ncbi:hypothetical protein N7471_003749 [Penicillium samsonianum]|uniref:uncharacterized protein n=1 Tax=Penicillium samsonianum TaxID=1882272 RepID=UPI002548CA75|nr:uncharacterized protein N7471_003749 [Penicillium samsonianum]KAJ6137263.1 hypothetical protein N7471_003749 [Penicillium samsonianum]
MPLENNAIIEHISNRISPEPWEFNGVNGFKSAVQTSAERLTKALFSESVEAKLWIVAAHALESSNPPVLYPEYTDERGNYVYRTLDFWTSGFFPGSMYLLLERSILYNRNACLPKPVNNNPEIRPHPLQLEHLCRWWTTNLHQNALKRDTHDVGFMIAPWAMKAWELKRDPAAFGSLVMAAHSLASRFNTVTQCLRSWDVCITNRYKFTDPSLDFLVIIDNMLNLDLLFWAAKETSNFALYDIALAHARTTQKHHIRKDNSTFHVVNLDVETGNVKSRFTNQGYSDDSCWARGQAWGILGFMQTFHWTQDLSFMNLAKDLADYFIAHLPADGVPYWDFNAPVTEACPRDTSAAMIAACGMLLIYKELMGSQEADHYLCQSVKLVNNVVDKFLGRETIRFEAKPLVSQVSVYPNDCIHEQTGDGFDILQVVHDNSTTSKASQTILGGATINNYEFAPRRWSNHGLVYADYYFLLYGNMILEMGLGSSIA